MVFFLQRFYRHFELKEKKDNERQTQKFRGIKERPPYLYILKKCFPQLLNVFIVFYVTLSIFPAVHSGKCLPSTRIKYSKLYLFFRCTTC